MLQMLPGGIPSSKRVDGERKIPKTCRVSFSGGGRTLHEACAVILHQSWVEGDELGNSNLSRFLIKVKLEGK